jgi:hypothetical protein
MHRNLLLLLLTASPAAADSVSFTRDVQPILSDRCYHCHGPDPRSRKADLRLDDLASAIAAGAIVPGQAKESEVIRRITATDATEVMPPRKSGKALSAKEKATLRAWIDQGARWEKHWSFVPPQRPTVPKTGPTGWSHNPIDAFVLDRLNRSGLAPAPPAPAHTLVRRLALDLTGLPPTPEEVERYLRDSSPDAYARLVERLLASRHFGERLAMDWLDAARYADTDGYQGDATRTNWPWRDWVVSAFNQNMPFDRFTLEQFAGDLLPGATPEQRLATCFHRNHMTNGEGGRDPEESRVDYVLDRVNTIGTAWLGLTLGCCQCHDHKFDPLTQKDYYRLSAFFNSIDEDGRAGTAAKPYLKYQSPHAVRAVAVAQYLVDERRAAEVAARQAAGPAFEKWLAERRAEVRTGRRAWISLIPTWLESSEGSALTCTNGVITAGGHNPRHDDYRISGRPALSRLTGFRLEVLPGDRGLGRSESGHFILTDVKVQVQVPGREQVREVAVAAAAADYSADTKANGGYGNIKDTLDDDPRNGWANFGIDPRQPRTAVFAFAEPLTLSGDEELTIELRHRSTQGHLSIGRFCLSVTDQAGETVRAVGSAPLDELATNSSGDPQRLDAKLRSRLLEQFLLDHSSYAVIRASLDKAERQLAEARAAASVNVMVLAERTTPRQTHVLVRGVWDRKGEQVSPAAPGVLAERPGGAAATRLGLARWLTDRTNPLTARVAVNRLWQQCFGAGLVRTPEDFGVQGEPPTHPKLLDWLAVEFVESGWDVKHLLRVIVNSETYRQSSDVSPLLRTRDPDNRLLARQGRYRLPSWMIRDAALRTSGLLNSAVGGPPVRPYQPPGVWEDISMGRNRYDPTDGVEQYRRTLYAFWRRSAAPAFLFDTAQRRVCEVRAPRTNTPLQALTLLNDTTYVEAARAVAAAALADAPDECTRLAQIVRRVLYRPPTAPEAAVLTREHHRALSHYRTHHADAARWLQPGQFRASPNLDPAELAALTVVANLVLNLDEAITRE